MQAVRCTRSVLAAVASASFLAACGGGVWLGFGDGFDDLPPVVSLAASVASVQAGQSARFVAAASDENGIDEVAFYRVDATQSVLISRDNTVPYEALVQAPADGRTTLSVFARATDDFGNQADSSVVTITVTP
jgi:hypothetical protein